MGKVSNLKKRYNKVPDDIFNLFEETIISGTQKYLEYLLRSWTAHSGNIVNDPHLLIKWVTQFNELLPYIPNKDIYHNTYKNLSYLISVNATASKVKIGKMSRRQKEKEIDILKETDTYLLLYPKTHEASLKYGSTTTWCTAMKDQSATFTKHHRQHLVYLISKKKVKRSKDYEKIAFYTPTNLNVGINSQYRIYNACDDSISGEKLSDNGWTVFEQLDIDQTYRHFVLTNKMEQPKRTMFDNDTDVGRFGYTPIDMDVNAMYGESMMTHAFDSCTALTGVPPSAFGERLSVNDPVPEFGSLPAAWSDLAHPPREVRRDIMFRTFQHEKVQRNFPGQSRSQHNMAMGMDVASGNDRTTITHHLGHHRQVEAPTPTGNIDISHLSEQERQELHQNLVGNVPVIDHISLLNPETQRSEERQTDFMKQIDKFTKLFREQKIWKEQ